MREQYVPLTSLETLNWPEEFVQYYLRYPCPFEGGGLNNWLFTSCLHCLRSLVDEELAIGLLRPVAAAAGREKESELTRQVECAYAAVGHPGATAGHPRWPREDETGLKIAIEADKKILFHVEQRNAREILALLMPGNPLINVAYSRKTDGFTEHLEEFKTLESFQFIVPNPMVSQYWLKPDGTISHKGNANTGPRRFIVTEFDRLSFEDQARVIAWLDWKYGADLKLVMIVHSRGKSLHAWWGCENQEAEKVTNFFRVAVSLGADKQLFVPSQFVRLPQGTRTTETNPFLSPKKQQVIYFEPDALL